MPREVFIAGQILTAAEMNSVSDQTVMVFAGTAARGSAIPTPSEGMVTYLSDVNQVQAYTGSAFKPVSGILQVVQTVKTDTFSTSSTSYVDVTGLTATITPTATSSKILVLIQVSGAPSSTATGGIHFRINGGNASTYVGDAAGSRTRGIGFFNVASGANGFFESVASFAGNYLDSPNTTSATTYAVQARSGTGTVYVNRNHNDSDAATSGRGASSITLIEVAG